MASGLGDQIVSCCPNSPPPIADSRLVERDYANGPTTGLLGRISHRARYAVHSSLLLICDSRLLCTRRSAMPKAKRKQLNIGITPDQYEAVRIAAEEEGVTITVYCRSAIMEKAAPEPGDPPT